jgi:hypothetical protein
VGLLAGMANAQISGRVIAPDLSAIDSAHVEVWDSYPDGSKQKAVFCDINGEFTVTDLSAGTYDVRAWKARATELYYPAYVLDVSYPYSGELLLTLVPTPEIAITPWWCDYADTTAGSTFLGYPLRRGDVIGVQDPDGVWCGMLTRYETDATDGAYVVHIYGDDAGTDGVDEGAELGDELTFFINNKPAALVGGPGTWTSPGFYYFPAQSASNDFEAVKVTGPADVSASEGETLYLDFTITNQGNHADGYDLLAMAVNGWSFDIPGGAASGSLNPDESTTITVQVEVPSPVSSYINEYIYLFATSQVNNAVIGVDNAFLEAGPNGIFEEEGAVPEQYFLAQNYPNPFNPTTRVAFGLQQGSHTTITVYNLLGQEVTELLDGYRAAGAHVVTWDGTDFQGRTVPSGIYFYRLQADEFTQTRKMVLMK